MRPARHEGPAGRDHGSDNAKADQTVHAGHAGSRRAPPGQQDGGAREGDDRQRRRARGQRQGAAHRAFGDAVRIDVEQNGKHHRPHAEGHRNGETGGDTGHFGADPRLDLVGVGGGREAIAHRRDTPRHAPQVRARRPGQGRRRTEE